MAGTASSKALASSVRTAPGFDTPTTSGIERGGHAVNSGPPEAVTPPPPAGWVVVGVALIGWTSLALADRSDVGRRYTGGYMAAAIVTGPELLADPTWESRLGYTVGVYARWSSVMQIFDVQGQYDFSAYELNEDQQHATIQRHSLSSSVNLHPLFLRILHNNWAWYVLSGWYLQIGGGLEITLMEGSALAEPRDDVALSIHLGTGLDIPLHDPNDWGGFWIGFNYRYKLVFMSPGIGGHEDLDAHQLLFSVSYRYNNLSFARIPRPPELEYR